MWEKKQRKLKRNISAFFSPPKGEITHLCSIGRLETGSVTERIHSCYRATSRCVYSYLRIITGWDVCWQVAFQTEQYAVAKKACGELWSHYTVPDTRSQIEQDRLASRRLAGHHSQ